MKLKVNGWLLSVNCLTNIAKTQPHTAFLLSHMGYLASGSVCVEQSPTLAIS